MESATIFRPDLIETVPQMSLPWFCALLSQQYHSSQNGEASMYNDSRIVLHNICRILGNSQCKWLFVSSSASRTFASSSVFPEKFVFYMGMIVSTVLPSLVPQKRIDDCFEIHLPRRGLCDPQLSSHRTSLHEVELRQCVFCTEPMRFWFSSRYGNFGPSGRE